MKPIRHSLATDIENRSYSTSKDARLVNCYVDTVGDKRKVVKRPGLASSTTSPVIPASYLNGMYAFNGSLYLGSNGSLYSLVPFGLIAVVTAASTARAVNGSMVNTITLG